MCHITEAHHMAGKAGIPQTQLLGMYTSGMYGEAKSTSIRSTTDLEADL